MVTWSVASFNPKGCCGRKKTYLWWTCKSLIVQYCTLALSSHSNTHLNYVWRLKTMYNVHSTENKVTVLLSCIPELRYSPEVKVLRWQSFTSMITVTAPKNGIVCHQSKIQSSMLLIQWVFTKCSLSKVEKCNTYGIISFREYFLKTITLTSVTIMWY